MCIRDSTYTENICKIVNGETGVNLWNNDWVDEPYKGAFPPVSYTHLDVYKRQP